MVDAPLAQLSSQELHFFLQDVDYGSKLRYCTYISKLWNYVSPCIKILLDSTMDITNCLLMIGCFRYLLQFSSIPSNWLIAFDDSLLKTYSHATAPSTSIHSRAMFVGAFNLCRQRKIGAVWLLGVHEAMSNSAILWALAFRQLRIYFFRPSAFFICSPLSESFPRYWERKSGWFLDFHEFLE